MSAQDIIGVGWKFPISINEKGRLSYSRGPDRIRDAIWIVLGTAAGERVMRETFGAGATDHVFDSNSDVVRTRLAADISAALAKWEPRRSPKNPAAKASDSNQMSAALPDVSTGDIVTGRGVSYVKYELARTYVAAVAEVEVNRKTGVIRVPRFYMAHDCGQIINPDGLKNQLEGNVIQTVSRTLLEELKFDRAMVTSLDWESYPIIKFPDVPEIVMDLIDRPAERPWGAGEPAAAVIPSAISNAIFDATGVRLRSVPYTPDKVKQAMA